MADTGRTVFADGLWSSDFWAAGLWAANEAVAVPNVVGQTQTAGTATLQGAGFTVAVVTAYSSTVAAGLIISQVPAGGASAVAGSIVTITVSLGVRADGAGKRTTLHVRRNLYVEIDGQQFPVESAQHAQALLERAAELAQQSAQAKAAKVVNAAQVTPQKAVQQIEVAAPEIKTNAPVRLKPYRDRIEQAYRAAAVEAEIRLRLAYEQMIDDEEAAMLLLS